MAIAYSFSWHGKLRGITLSEVSEKEANRKCKVGGLAAHAPETNANLFCQMATASMIS
jgi:hypothetical protein